MKRCVILLMLLIAAVFSRAAEKPQLLEKAAVLPLALDDSLQFRKTELFFNDTLTAQPPSTQNEMINFERQRVNYGAITGVDRRARMGNYFTFFWNTKRHAHLTFRLEYRQEKLGAFVQAQEVNYPEVHGSQQTKFSVIGDDYFENGRVTAWRALLIENGKIVGLTQSFLWN